MHFTQHSCYRLPSSTGSWPFCTLWIYSGRLGTDVSVSALTEVNVKNVRVCGRSPFTALVEMGASHHMFGPKSALGFGFNLPESLAGMQSVLELGAGVAHVEAFSVDAVVRVELQN